MIKATCPRCGIELNGVFPVSCSNCDFSVIPLAGSPVSPFQISKWDKHTDIVRGRDISLYGGSYNASFDHNGTTVLSDLLRFAITFGDKAVLPSRGDKENVAIVCYIPEPIGAGTALYSVGTVSCSGIAILSPSSVNFGHTFPVMNDWVSSNFGSIKSTCKMCGKFTDFAQPICGDCYRDKVMNWQDLVK